MRRRPILPLVAAALVVACRTHATAPLSAPAAGVTLELIPAASVVRLEDVRSGAVRFTASIRNESDETLTIAHPSACMQAAVEEAGGAPPDVLRKRSEIVLTILQPGGEVLVLRENWLTSFDPGNVPVLTIPPHGTGAFHVGWFFENARGRWDHDDEAAVAFLARGAYVVSLLVRNELPRATWHGGRPLDVWTGVLESPPIELVVE